MVEIAFLIVGTVLLAISVWGWVGFALTVKAQKPFNINTPSEFLSMGIMGLGFVVLYWLWWLGGLLVFMGFIAGFILRRILRHITKRRYFSIPDEEMKHYIKKRQNISDSKDENILKEEPEIPLWCSSLRPELRPTGERIDTLETLWAKYEIPHQVFGEALASYPDAARLLQINLYKQAKERWPNLSEKDLLKNVFVGRALKPEPYGYGMTPDEFEKVMGKIRSLKELCDYVVWRDSKEPVQQFDLSEWETYVQMLRKAGIGTDIDWQRHRRNAERMRRDNIRANIYGIMEEEARVAMAEMEGEVGANSENKKEQPRCSQRRRTTYGLRG